MLPKKFKRAFGFYVSDHRKAVENILKAESDYVSDSPEAVSAKCRCIVPMLCCGVDKAVEGEVDEYLGCPGRVQ